MKFSCKHCGLGYRIPDERVLEAGDAGLRIRCKRCRVVLAVDASMAEVEDTTRPDLPRLKQRPPPRPRKKSVFDQPGVPALTAVMDAAEPGPLPAALGLDGGYAPIPGVRRDVTGIFLEQADKKTGRVWYAAVEGRPRGPFTEREMKLLANKGKVRGRTLVWRPGFASWVKVRTGHAEAKELDWLRDVVIARKRQEVRATEKARAKLGIHTIVLDDGPGRREPPPLPGEGVMDADDVDGLTALPPEASGAFKKLERNAQRRRRLALVAAGLWVTLALVSAAYTLPWVVGHFAPTAG